MEFGISLVDLEDKLKEHLETENVIVTWFAYILGNAKMLAISPNYPGYYFEVTFSAKNEDYSIATYYKTIEERVN